jgi:uncharacterized protein
MGMDKGAKAALITLIMILVVLLVMPFSIAVTTTGHIKLLAVYQEDEEFRGSPADVQLEIKQGSGRVFLETIPLSKVDTQISTRFAKEIACKFAEMDCDSYDFFYTIKSPAGIVGGPSAGGAISALTVAMLLDLDVNQETAMTGTINSGELIGPVGSLKKKIDAAEEAEVTKVLIPAVQAAQEEDNITNIIDYGKEIGVEVVPVGTLGDAVQEFTGEVFEEEEREINVPQSYSETMQMVTETLCKRTDELISEFDVFDLSDKESVDFDLVNMQREALNLTEKGKKAFEAGNYYSAASYCFGANVQANTLLYTVKELTPEESAEEAKVLMQKIDDFDKVTEKREKETITDLQTYMIVKERILEARHHLATGNNDSSAFGYVNERLNSAVAWSEFFGNGGEVYNIDDESLKKSCAEILGEVDERFQYLNLFFPGLLNNLKNNLLTAHKHYETEEYALCIYLASRTKAEANIMVTMLGVKEEVVDDVLEQKLIAAKRAVTKQIDKGIFPIIAYSYYEYAISLHEEENNAAALLYSEYGLELSDIDIYFEKKKSSVLLPGMKSKLKTYLPTVIFIWGVVLGFILGWIVLRERRRPVKGGAAKKSKAKAVKKRVIIRKKAKTRTRLRLS